MLFPRQGDGREPFTLLPLDRGEAALLLLPPGQGGGREGGGSDTVPGTGTRAATGYPLPASP